MNQYRIARKGAYHRAKRATGVAMLASLLALLAACSGDGTVAAPPVSGPLPGSGTALARDAITTVDVGDTYTPAEISIGPNGEEIIRTKLEIVFRPQATVAEVNELLNAINASITTSIAGLEGLVVRIPDPLTLAALDTIVADIESRPFVWFVRRALMPEREVLPTNIQPTAENAIHIRHHLAVGAQGAWNARAAATTAPHVLVVDRFGDGPPDNALNYTYAGNAANDFATGNTNAHGYHVAGIIGGAFGGPDTDRGYVTGMLPRTMQLSAVDMEKIDPLDAEKHLFQRVQSIGAGTVIVNTSFGYGCNTFVTCLAIEEIREQAAWWLIQVRTLGLEGRFLHLKSAGNVQPPFFVDEARYNLYAGAALFADLVDSAGAPLAPLTNLLAVENAWPTQEFPYASTPCLAVTSYIDGHIAAIGKEVWSFVDASANAGYLGGTSMAAPQVAGLAAYLLSIRPDLTPQEIKAILLDTAKPVPVLIDPACSATTTPSPIIDAYAAVLALDHPAGLTSGSLADAPVRRALFDLDDNGAFTEADLQGATLGYDTSLGSANEFLRSDFNNDTLTGGTETGSFDLDMDGLIGTASMPINGVPSYFDEAALTDLEILCYYAYSALYAGDALTRDQHLLPYQQTGQCGAPATLGVSFPAVVTPDTPTLLTVTVRTQAGDPVAGAYVELTANGGTVSAASGTTDAAGEFATNVTIASGNPTVTVNVTLFSAPGGTVLASASVQATAGAVGQVVMLDRSEGSGLVEGPDYPYHVAPGIYFGATNWFLTYTQPFPPAVMTTEIMNTDVVAGSGANEISAIRLMHRSDAASPVDTNSAGGTFFWIGFRVLNDPVPYSMTATASASNVRPNNVAALRIIPVAQGSVPSFRFPYGYYPGNYGSDVCAGTVPCNGQVSSLSVSYDYIAPGDYYLVGTTWVATEGAGSTTSILTMDLEFNPPPP